MVQELLSKKKWDFEVAFHGDLEEGVGASFHDKDNDGAVDCILLRDEEDAPTQVFARDGNGRWERKADVDFALLTPVYLRDRELRRRLETLVERLMKELEEEEE